MEISGFSVNGKGQQGSRRGGHSAQRTARGRQVNAHSSGDPKKNAAVVAQRRGRRNVSNHGRSEERCYESKMDSGARAAAASSSSGASRRRQSKHSVNANGIYIHSSSGADVSEDYIDPKTCPGPERKPKGLVRPKVWSVEAEEAFRLQQCGWKDLYEYESVYGAPTRWLANNFIRKLQCKKNGFYTYFKAEAECENKDLRLVKVYSY